MPRLYAAFGTRLPSDRLLRHGVWCACFSFNRCHLHLSVPFDPNLHGLFDGEELPFGVRAWTSGYDLYTPIITPLAHIYSDVAEGRRGNRSKFIWWNNTGLPKSRRTAASRVRSLLGIHQNSQSDLIGRPYGLGTRRSLDQYKSMMATNFSSRPLHRNMSQNPPKPHACRDVRIFLSCRNEHHESFFFFLNCEAEPPWVPAAALIEPHPFHTFEPLPLKMLPDTLNKLSNRRKL